MLSNYVAERAELFYCLSYQAFLMGLYLIRCGRRIVFVTQNQNIIRTCEQLDLEVIKLVSFSQKHICFNSGKVKKYINQLCLLGDGVPLHFSHTQFDSFCFLLINAYSKVAPIFFYNFEVEYGVVEKISLDYGFLKTLFLRLMMKKIYECECVIKKVRGVYLIGIDREFLERHNIETVDNKDTYYEQIAEAIKDRQIELKKCQNLFLYQDFSNVTWQRSINAIYDLLNKKDFVVKSHPSKKIAEAALRNMCQYPKHLPSELIFGNIDKNVVAIYSSSLISASKFSHLKAISLIELVEWRNNDYKMFLKKDLVTNSNGKIFFPESFDELSALL